MASIILLLTMAAPGQPDADRDRRQVYEIGLEHRLGDLDDRANHTDAVYLDILPRAAAPIDPDSLVQSREVFRLRAENHRLPFNRDGYLSYWLSLKRLEVEYTEIARDLDGIGRAALAAHARRQAGLWTERAESMGQAIEQSKTESERIARMMCTGELESEPQALRERVNPIFRLFRFLGTIPPLHAIAVFAALALAISRGRPRANR